MARAGTARSEVSKWQEWNGMLGIGGHAHRSGPERRGAAGTERTVQERFGTVSQAWHAMGEAAVERSSVESDVEERYAPYWLESKGRLRVG